MGFRCVRIFAALLYASTTIFTQGDGSEEHTTTSYTPLGNLSSQDNIQGTTSANASSDNFFEGNGTTSTAAPTTNGTKKRRRGEQTTEPPDPTCGVYTAQTDGDKCLIGCTIYCENYTKPFDYRRECVNITLEAAHAMQPGIRYLCPMGFCLRGYCYRTGMKLPCWTG
uniref:Evasin n=1 Tax=Amblyomma triste TaxID=251400 RepID=A0A023G2V9_AMBTT